MPEPRVVLVVEESAGMRLLRGLHGRGADIVLVLSRGPVGRAAAELGYDVLPPDRVTDPAFADAVAETDLLLNAHSLHIIAPEVLDAPSLGCLNLHPGPLPEYAGLNTPCWAIYEGAEIFGVTLHRMVPEVDAGPIASQRRWRMSGEEIALDVWSRCAREGVELILELMEGISNGVGSLPAHPQDLSRRKYFGPAPPRGGRISWEMPAAEIERFVRACDFGPFGSPWGRPRARLLDREVRVLEASVLDEPCHAEPGTARKLSEHGFRVAGADAWLEIRVRGAAD